MVNRRPEQTRARIAQTASRLRSLAHPAAVAPDELVVSEATGRIPLEEARRLPYRPAEIGETFGPQWATYWFRLAATVPEAWAGRPVELVWDSGCEATLYRGGEPVQGLVEGGGYDRTTAPLGTPSGRVELELEMACNDLMGLPDPFPLRRDRTGRTWQEPAEDRSLRAPRPPARLARAGLALLDGEAWEMAWDLEALRQLSDEPGLDPAWAGRLLAELDRFARTWIAGDRATWPEARAILGDLLAHRNAGSAHDVTAIGHAHIDTAWLWPLAETRRKIVRTWSSQLALMDRYPEHRFAASSAQHYAWLEQDAPRPLRAALRARAGGPLGGGRRLVGGARPQPALRRVARAPARSTASAICSSASARAAASSGPRTRSATTARSRRSCAAPGSTASSPRSSPGTSSPSRRTTRSRGRGIDGSRGARALAAGRHLQRRARASPSCARAAARFKDHDRTAASLLVFGHGDGGGGPTAEMLEIGRAGSRDLQGVPRVQLASTRRGSSTRSRRTSTSRARSSGELYFEYHRGTYTSQARTKRGNRARRAAAARGRGRRGDRAPARPRGLSRAGAARRCGRPLLLNQFHDILPGSSIREVYEDAERDHAHVAARAAELRDAAIAALGGRARPRR